MRAWDAGAARRSRREDLDAVSVEKTGPTSGPRVVEKEREGARAWTGAAGVLGQGEAEGRSGSRPGEREAAGPRGRANWAERGIGPGGRFASWTAGLKARRGKTGPAWKGWAGPVWAFYSFPFLLFQTTQPI